MIKNMIRTDESSMTIHDRTLRDLLTIEVFSKSMITHACNSAEKQEGSNGEKFI